MPNKLLTGLVIGLALIPWNAWSESIWDKPTPTFKEPVEITVYRSPTCGCCGKWEDHVKKHGFKVIDQMVQDMASIKQKYGVPKNLQSCHTAIVNGYAIEGHVPAGDIKQLLTSRPALAGIAAPGMPAGSPGMEMGNKKDPFQIIGFDKSGKTSVFSDHSGY